jgi:hypothetical protein
MKTKRVPKRPKKKTLYIGCAINNLPANKKDEFLGMVADLKRKLRKKFRILEFMSAIKADATAEEIYWRDIHVCVKSADAMVAICDHPSTGLGYEMAVAIEERGIPVLAMAQYLSNVSKLVLGIHGRGADKKAFNFVRYNTVADIPRIVEEQFAIRDHMEKAKRKQVRSAKK